MDSSAGMQAATSSAILWLQNVSIVRDKGGQRFALHVPSLVVQPGEFVALVGPSGCGKSTLLDVLALVLRPTAAEVFTLRVSCQATAYAVMALAEPELAHLRRSEIGYVLQTGGLLPFLTVKDNLLLPCWLNGMVDAEARVQRLVGRLGIAEQVRKKPPFLSGGQRQRVAIARALVHMPSLVLADEPTAAVDKPTALEIRDTFKELTQQLGVTVCLVTHDASLVANTAERTFGFTVHKESATITHATCYEKGFPGADHNH